jgi:hypothetical protein
MPPACQLLNCSATPTATQVSFPAAATPAAAAAPAPAAARQTVLDRIQMLVPLFSKLTMEQVVSFAKVVQSLSPGQIVLSIHLLDTFGFAVDAIGQHIPQVSSGASSYWIGPIKVTVADISSSSSQVSRRSGFASWFRHPLFGSFFG